MTQCSSCETNEQPLIYCDKCILAFCEKCAPISSTEWRSIILKKRRIIFLCTDCKTIFEVFLQTDSGAGSKGAQTVTPLEENSTTNSLIKHIKNQFTLLSESLISKLDSEIKSQFRSVHDEVSNLRQTNSDLLKLLFPGKQLTLPTPKSLSCSNFSLPDVGSLFVALDGRQVSLR